jgi:hypothetical protein
MCRAVVLVVFLTLASVAAGHAQAQTQARAASRYAPLGEYMMPREAEVALAKSAAPPNVSGRATVKVLTPSGFQVVREGTNGFVCLVMRGWAAPTFTPAAQRDLVYDETLRAPICVDPEATRMVLPFYELKHRLGMEGRTPDQIADAVQAAYVRGQLPRRDAVSFGYMWSADQQLGPGVGHWHPHMMVFAPYYDNPMLGGNEGGAVPVVNDDPGTPFTVVLIPVDGALAIGAAGTARPTP